VFFAGFLHMHILTLTTYFFQIKNAEKIQQR